jgi:hypothetical protein
VRQQVREQYRGLHLRAVQRKLWAALTGRRHRLLSLHDVQRPNGQGQVRSYAGLRLVPLVQIRGSEGRSSDFDADFRPLKTYDEERWVRVAVAHQLGVGLPPVDLVQVDDDYFVRDGHHRISVAKLLGQQEIEAEVTVWRGAASPGGGTAVQPAPLETSRRALLRSSRWTGKCTCTKVYNHHTDEMLNKEQRCRLNN